jgi:hypothetical protein
MGFDWNTVFYAFDFAVVPVLVVAILKGKLDWLIDFLPGVG